MHVLLIDTCTALCLQFASTTSIPESVQVMIYVVQECGIAMKHAQLHT